MVDVRKGIRSREKTVLQYSSLTPLERECYEGEVQPYRKTDYKPIIYIHHPKYMMYIYYVIYCLTLSKCEDTFYTPYLQFAVNINPSQDYTRVEVSLIGTPFQCQPHLSLYINCPTLHNPHSDTCFPRPRSKSQARKKQPQ